MPREAEPVVPADDLFDALDSLESAMVHESGCASMAEVGDDIPFPCDCQAQEWVRDAIVAAKKLTAPASGRV